MMPFVRTRTLLLIVALQTISTCTGMTVPFSHMQEDHDGSTNYNYNYNGNGNSQWHETTASGIPTTGADWISLPNGQEFQPATFDQQEGHHGEQDQQQQDKLVRAQRRFLGYRDNFVDGTETFYSERSQAWRLLGVYIDCDAQANENHSGDRKLEDVQSCQRYMLWAAVSTDERRKCGRLDA